MRFLVLTTCDMKFVWLVFLFQKWFHLWYLSWFLKMRKKIHYAASLMEVSLWQVVSIHMSKLGFEIRSRPIWLTVFYLTIVTHIPFLYRAILDENYYFSFILFFIYFILFFYFIIWGSYEMCAQDYLLILFFGITIDTTWGIIHRSAGD